MANNQNFKELSNCLEKASEICKKIISAPESSSNISRPSSSSSSIESAIGQAVVRANAMMNTAQKSGVYSRLNGKERLIVQSSYEILWARVKQIATESFLAPNDTSKYTY